MIVRFARDLFGFVTSAQQLAVARTQPLRIAYFVTLHILAAFIVAVSFTGDITTLTRRASETLQKLPSGMVATKQGDRLTVTGVPQPFTFSDGSLVMTIDTTGATSARPASSTVFISADRMEVVGAGASAPAESMRWSEGDDFVLPIDKVRTLLSDYEATAVTVLTMFMFLSFVIGSVIFSIVLVVVWSVFIALTHRLMFGQKISIRDALALHLVALSAPVLLWALSVVSGIGPAPLVETIAFVVYSVIGLRFAVPPAAASGSTSAPPSTRA